MKPTGTIPGWSLLALLVFSLLPIVSNASEGPKNLRIAIAVNAGTPHYDAGQRFCRVLERLSHGRIRATMFGGSVLGKDIAVVSSMRGGFLDMGIMNANLLTGLIPEIGVLDFPFVFPDERVAHRVLDGPFGTRLSNYMRQHGLVNLGWWEAGYLSYHTGKRPINRIEDLAGLKIRVAETPLQIDFQNALGANAIPLPYVELYTALEQRAVDGGTQILINLKAAKLYEVQKYVTITKHIYNPMVLLMAEKSYDRLSPEEREYVHAAAREATAYQRELAQEYDREALAFLKTKLQVNVLPPLEIARMKERTRFLIDKYAIKFGPAAASEMLAEIEKAAAAR